MRGIKCFYLRIVFSPLNLNNLIMKQRDNTGNNLLLFHVYTMCLTCVYFVDTEQNSSSFLTPTTWTVGHIIPAHASEVFSEIQLGLKCSVYGGPRSQAYGNSKV